MCTQVLALPVVIVALLTFGGCAVSTKVCRDFNAIGVSHVIFRAEQALDATILQSTKPGTVSVCGVAKGGVEGYHPPDSNWRETPPSEWGLDLESKRFANVLIISTENEKQYIHHYYYLDNLVVRVPEGIAVQKVRRILTGDGSPDLNAPEHSNY